MEDNYKNIVPIELITKVLALEASKEELIALESWIAESEENKIEYEAFKEIWTQTDEIKSVNKIDVDAEWKSFKENVIDIEKINKEDNSLKIKHTEHHFFGQFLRVAAVVLLLLLPASYGLYDYFTSHNSIELYAEADVMKNILPDGSRVTLNKGTLLEYKKDIDKRKTREVTLEGEAFFDVKSDKQKPFIIHAYPLLIKVVGTSFYVNASSKGENVEVVVESGIVEVMHKDNTVTYSLTVGEKISFDKSKKIFEEEKAVVEEDNYHSWKTRKIFFKKSPLKQIAKKLYQVYGVEVVIIDDRIKDCRLTNSFEGHTLDQVLDVIEATIEVEIERKEDRIIISGSGC